jgi:hypothetical protein
MSDHYSNEQIDTLIELLNRMRNHEFRVYEFHKVIQELDKIQKSQRELNESTQQFKSLSRLWSDIQP